MLQMRVLASMLAALALFSAGCGKSKKPISVGSKNSTEQILVGEIVAQHLEDRLKRKVERRLALGPTPIVYQALVNGQLTLYPEYTGVIESEIIKEQAPTDTQMVFERARVEMARISQLELLPSLGYENPPVMVVRNADAEKAKISTLSEAAQASQKWKVGTSFEFQQRKDGIPVLNSYKLPMTSGYRGMEQIQLFASLSRGDVTMIAAEAVDNRLLSPEFKVLTDDRKAFPAYQACLLVRQTAIADEPLLRAALDELTGRISLDTIHKLTAQIDAEHRPVGDVAKEFLSSIGLR